jgi:phosphomannomutase
MLYQGLCAYVLAHIDDARDRGAVIGYDHRHNSERWARLTAAVFIDKGVKAYLYRGLVHTPMRVIYRDFGRSARVAQPDLGSPLA